MFRGWRNMTVGLHYWLWVNKRQVIETCDTPTVSQVERRDGRVGTIILVREACPNTLVHSMERLGTVHEREGGNIGQVDLDQVSVGCLQLGGVGFTGDRLDYFIGSRILVAAPVAVPVVLRLSEFRADQMADTSPRLGWASAVTPHHEDIIARVRESLPIGDVGLINGPFRIVGRDFNTDVFSSGSNHFNFPLPLRPAIGAGCYVAKLFTIVFAPAISIGIFNPGIIQEFLGAFDVLASPLQVRHSRVVIQ